MDSTSSSPSPTSPSASAGASGAGGEDGAADGGLDGNCRPSLPSSLMLSSQEPGVQEVVTVQVDMSNFVGRIKEKPVCTDKVLKAEAMTTEELSRMTFPVIEATTTTPKGHSSIIGDVAAENSTSTATKATTTTASSTTAANDQHHNPQHEHATVVSSASSTASRESVWSDHETSERINLKVTTQSVSRNGRQTQRWQTDAGSQRTYRLVTGCVPIVDGGKVLFASASRKSEWILPKGGWEKDEEMEESAIRETFEEAGVLGILGPRLTEIEYETRKAKKRRLEFEEVQRKAKQMRDAPSPSPKSPEAAIRNCEDRTPQSSAAKISSDSVHSATIAPSSPPSASALEQHVPDKVLHRIRGHASKSHHSSDAETASVASESSTNTYTHVRMTLMPLYVTEVRGEWPERGRFRKAVDIDEAIRITESRPEFQAALIEVKEKNLHLPHLNKPSSTANVVTPSAPMAPSSNGSTGTATLLWNAKER